MIKAYDWQQPSVDRMVDILSTGNFCLNASDTGTGKTVTALAAAAKLNVKALVVCPKQVHTAWLRTAEAMGCSQVIDGIVNSEKLQFTNPYFKNNTWLLPKDRLIIWDEVHRGASGPKSTTTKILALTRPLGYKVLAMSATVASSPLQLRAVGYLAGLHQFKPASYWPWCIENGCFKQPPIRGLMFPKGRMGTLHMLKIHEDLSGVLVRVRRDEVPDFPATTILCNLYDLDNTYAKAVEKAWAEMREALKKPRPDILTERLRARETTELCKVELLTDLVTNAVEEGSSVVAFVNFRSTLARLHGALNAHNPGMIFGGQSNLARQDVIDGFQVDKFHVLLCMGQAGGLGISLHQLPGMRPRVSFLTPSDRVDELTQCLGRIHRSGGGASIQTIVLAAGTVEDKIHKNLQGKLGNLSALQDGDLEVS